jgi:hypothetical protein
MKINEGQGEGEISDSSNYGTLPLTPTLPRQGGGRV